MRAAAKALRIRRDRSARQLEVATRTILAFSGAFLSIVGLLLAASGLTSPRDSSAFMFAAGLGLTLSGALIAKRNRAGAWTYLGVVAVTVSWSLRNADEGASLGYRLLGPILLLAMLAALMPVLSKWHPRRAACVFSLIVIAIIGLGFCARGSGPLAQQTAAVTRFLDTQAKGVLQ